MWDIWRVGWCSVCVMFGALLASHATAQLVVQTPITDDRARTHNFNAPPQRIVSLLPSLTESVCALGACERLVGVDRFSNWPASVRKLPQLGGLDDAQIERIVALRPDVVLAATSARVVERLESLGLPVVVLHSQSHAHVRRSLELLAQLLGTPERAALAWAAIESEMQLAAARVPALLRGQKVYFEIASDPIAAGAASFIGETLARLGLGNVVPPELGPFPKLNAEFVVRAQPDIVMASMRELRTMPSRPGWASLKALHGRSCGFSAERYEMLVRPGPRLGEAAAVLADCLQSIAPAR